MVTDGHGWSRNGHGMVTDGHGMVTDGGVRFEINFLLHF
jgi:hypothetical protein